MCSVEVMRGKSIDSNNVIEGMSGKSNDCNNVIEGMLTTAGGKIVCRRCSAMSKRTKLQCGGPAIKGKTKCKFHGGLSTGPKSELGRQICSAVKTVNGKDTRVAREKHRLIAMKIRLCADLLGVPWRSDAGTKRKY